MKAIAGAKESSPGGSTALIKAMLPLFSFRLPLTALLLVFALGSPPLAHAGTLVIGQPAAANGNFSFPVALQGGGGQVSALDFRVQFDPQVFQPVSAEPGKAALAASKMVSANYAAPGEYVVVMMGLNQTPVADGPVAVVVMQRVGTEDLVSSPVSIANPTLAAPDGAELPANGSTVSVPLGGKAPDEGETPPTDDGSNDDGEGDDGGETPETPAPARPAPDGDSGGAPANPLRPVAPEMAAGLQDAPAAAPAAAPPGGAASPEENSGQGMPVVVGSAVPEAGASAIRAAAETGQTVGQRSRMAKAAEVGAPSDAPSDSVSNAETIESARDESTGQSSAAQAREEVAAPEGEEQGSAMTLAFAGAVLALLIAAALLLKKFSTR